MGYGGRLRGWSGQTQASLNFIWGSKMQHNPPDLSSFHLGQVYGEHFFVTGADQTVRVVVERMRDEGCPIAVITEDSKILGVIEGSTVAQRVVGQPAQWTQPASSLVQAVPVLDVKATVEEVRRHLSDQANSIVVVGNSEPVKVITRASWLRFLNFAINTAIFQASPHIEASVNRAAVAS